ncbi:ABC transporter permease [Clostridium coskatii]|uniref:Branched-chain amino acid transport system / permease component n=1 Tax=Clostridium coskatii TaxID=1705578 RepID=A0A162N8G7_9CLOT|nr:ABC transporter permease [Clostridium coskatii]OAA90189.1 Branched-chain amino acid transport system / permease component [Clostridium coskatii]OBR91033.1 branched-chain amino acid transport system / permease component [Clostridium coskatii]
MNSTFIISVFAAGVVAGTPLLYACLGELLTERAGVMNLGVEGMMLVGAVTGFIVSIHTKNQWFGFIAGIAAGAALAFFHAILTIKLKANQVASGVALTIFGTGLSAYLGKSYIGTLPAASFKAIDIPLLSKIPVIGTILFKNDLLVYLSFILVFVIWFVLYKTKSGLILRAAGENPGAADAAGINVFLVRYVCVILGGMLSGAGGAYISLAYSPSWSENMTAGRGWIAIALVIFALWDPIHAVVGAYIFGIISSLGLHLQAFGFVIPTYILQMLPYIFTFVVLIFTTRETKSRPSAMPKALGISYSREER